MSRTVGLAGFGRLPEVTVGTDPVAVRPDVDVVAVPFRRDGGDFVMGPGSADLLEAVGVEGADLLALLRHQEAAGTPGEVTDYPVLGGGTVIGRAAGRAGALRSVLAVGVGTAAVGDLRRTGAALARRVRGRALLVTSVPAVSDRAGLQGFVEGLVLGSFSYTRRTSPGPEPVGGVVVTGFTAGPGVDAAVRRGRIVAEASVLARTLAAVPANEKNPPWLADLAGEVAGERGLESQVWDERRLAREGFGGLLGVGRASSTPPRLVRLDYTPKRTSRRTAHVVVVGKGITFDTGGLSIKPADAMMNMKRDMTGAGVVLATLAALPDLDCRLKVTGLLACAENAISGDALRPGDVVRHYGGRTSEVTNTDAEGRLVLADALAYAVADLRPTVLVDIATLTGAAKIALGLRTGALFANDEALAGHLLDAGHAAGEPLWRMPLVDDYEERLESPIADADNAAGTPGAITAALFLQHFAGGLPWAHLDIASVADSPVDSFEWSTGPTGFGARVLLHWLAGDRPLDGVAVRARRTRGRTRDRA